MFSLLAPGVLAEIAEPLSVARLTAEAALIVRGRVESKTVQRNDEGRVFTQLELRVLEIWKGGWDREILPVVHGGGILGERGVKVLGQARYHPGEEAVLFLTPNGRGAFVTVGMAWGKFKVQDGTATQQGTSHPAKFPLAELKQAVERLNQ